MHDMNAVQWQLLTWNVEGPLSKRKANIDRKLAAVVAFAADVVALQEITTTTHHLWKEGLAANGYDVQTSIDQLSPGVSLRLQKAPVLIASKCPFDLLPAETALPWPECMLSARLQTSFGVVELHNVHVPPWYGDDEAKIRVGERKVDTLEAIYKRLARQVAYQRVLCGDLNTPEFLLPDGRFEPFRTGNKTQKERQARVEMDVLCGLAEFGLPDVVDVVPPGHPEQPSWSFIQNNKLKAEKYEHLGLTADEAKRRRFDHVFASPTLNPVKWKYLTSWLDEKPRRRSDHAPLLVKFETRGQP
jgi:exonuclease III